MNRKHHVLILLGLLLPLFITAVPALAADHPGTATLLTDPVPAHLVETDTEALYYWRAFAASRPPLILLSNDPLLRPIPQAALEPAKKLVRTGDLKDLRARAVYPSSDPLLFPGTALSMALDLDWFSQVIWIVPLKPDQDFPELQQFKDSLKGTVLGKQIDTAHLAMKDGCYTTDLQGTPLRICPLDTPVKIDRPAVLHFDLSYLQGGHLNPVATPLFKSLLEQARAMRNQHWPVLTATLSPSNIQGNISLDVRYLAGELEQLISDPAKLAQPDPVGLQLDNALFLENMFRPEEAHKIYLKLQQEHPDNAALNYLLYKSYSRMKEGAKALQALAEAVSLNRVYALEYLQLHERAKKKGQPAAALQMLDNAAAAFPKDPAITWSIADYLASSQHPALALPYLDQLQAMTWSKVYYPGTPKQLKEFRADLQKQIGEKGIETTTPPSERSKKPGGN